MSDSAPVAEEAWDWTLSLAREVVPGEASLLLPLLLLLLLLSLLLRCLRHSRNHSSAPLNSSSDTAGSSVCDALSALPPCC